MHPTDQSINNHFKNVMEKQKMTKEKMLKIKVGEFYDKDKKENVSVFTTAWPVTSKLGVNYYSISQPIFIQEFEKKEEEQDRIMP